MSSENHENIIILNVE